MPARPVPAPSVPAPSAPAPKPGRPAAAGSRGRGLATALVGLVLGLLSLPGPGLLTVAVGALQVLLVLTLLVLLDAPARTGATGIAVAAAVAADVVVLRGHGKVDGLAGVVALSLVAALVHQLSRRSARTHVTRSLVDTMVAVVLVAAAACLTALRAGTSGRAAAAAVLLAAAAGLLAGRGAGPLVHRLGELTGLLLGPVTGAAVGALVGALPGDRLSAGRGALLGLVAAAGVAVAERFVTDHDILPGPGARRRAAALRPVAVLLPYAALGPLALVAGRLALG